MWDKIKGAGAVVLGIGIFIGIALLIALFIHGGAWLGEKIYPWLVAISAFVIAIVVLLLLPLALFRKTRGFSGLGIIIASYVFGLTLWVWGLLLTYYLWGAIAVFIGLFLMGIGVVPIAMLATLFKGMWSTLGELVLLTVLTFGARFGGAFLIAKSESE